MASKEPTPAELKDMTSVGNLFKWLEMPDAVALDSYPRACADIEHIIIQHWRLAALLDSSTLDVARIGIPEPACAKAYLG